MNEVHLHWIPYEKEDNDDHDHDDVHDNVDDDNDDDVSPFAIDGVLRRRVPVQLLECVVHAVQDHGTHVAAILHLQLSSSSSVKRKKSTF